MSENRSADGSQALDPRRLLIDWANKQDSWVRRLVGQVIVSQRPISDGQAEALFEQFLAEKGLHESASEIVPELSYPQAGSAQSDPLRLLALSNVSGVNALSPGATIEFSPGLTILYGENGTGKTGYARILKRISAVHHPEEILPNINVSDPQTPAATIKYQIGDIQESVHWRNEVGTASSIGRCTVPVMMTGANTSTNRWRYQHARRTAGVARTRGDLPRAGRGSAGGLGRHRPSGGSTSHDGGPGDQRRGRP